jgi:hypothetical protein
VATSGRCPGHAVFYIAGADVATTCASADLLIT